ncbi:RNA polymerase sigma factor [Thalassotalea atypica]|uniref:RNA polymerase sigma factor n=1 Tax=Thalassotalea atypica TaxID=2054316 RepID=UPI00257345B5|nr:sigma-70 family RNA polymerase sigma factor [Thalassotalea atypica]
MFERSDETLVKQALKGKKSAWISLVKRYESNVYNYTYRMVSNPDDAMDLMQDVFVAVFRNLSTFRGDSPFKGWLFRIAHYRCIEFYRRKRPTQSLDDSPETIDETEHNCPEFTLSAGQQTGEIQQAMSKLSFNQRIVVELKFFQQRTFEDIAYQLGISTNTVKSRLYSALDKLKGFMEAVDV